jgi:hypothetical protein
LHRKPGEDERRRIDDGRARNAKREYGADMFRSPYT